MFTTTIYLDSDDEQDDKIEVTVYKKNEPPVVDLTDELVDPCGSSTLNTIDSSANEVRLTSILEAYMNINKKSSLNDEGIGSVEDDNDPKLDSQANALNGLNEYNGHLKDVIDLTDDSLNKYSRPSSPLLHVQHESVITPKDIDVTVNKQPTAIESDDKHTTKLPADTFYVLLDSWLTRILHSHSGIAKPAIMNDETLDASSSENTVDSIHLSDKPAKPSSIPLLNVILSTEEAMDIDANANENVINEISVTCPVGLNNLTEAKATAEEIIDSSEKHLVEPSVPLESELSSDNKLVTNRSTSDINKAIFTDNASVSATVESIGETDNVENVSKSNTAVGQRNVLRLKDLINKFNELKKNISDLEEKEVDFNDGENSDFIKIEDYKIKAFKVYEKICEITGQNIRSVKQPVKLKETEFPEFNLRLEKMINDKGNFPHVVDVFRCFKLCNEKYNYQLPESSCRTIAKKTFSQIGQTSKKRRKLDLDEMISYYSRNSEPDPALLDAELNAKLIANKKICRRL